jgi:acyl carrier protein
MSEAEIRAEIFRILSVFSKETVEALEERLRKKGDDLPLDSFQSVKVWRELETVFGVEFGYDFDAEKALRSVPRLTAYIKELRFAAGLDELEA